jgi:hypothetical protein
MSLGIKHLSQNITPDTSGIIWLTDDPLDYKTPGVYEFNYLLDGMLRVLLRTQMKIIKKINPISFWVRTLEPHYLLVIYRL